jgi:hypothetical protein
MRAILTSMVSALALLVLGATAAVAGPEPLPAEGRRGGSRTTLLDGGTDWSLVAGISTTVALVIAAAAVTAMVTVKHRHNAAHA